MCDVCRDQQMLKGTVRAGKVDCQAHHDMCQRAGVRSYPTVRFYPYLGTTRVSVGFVCLSRSLSQTYLHSYDLLLLTPLYYTHKPTLCLLLLVHTSPPQRDQGGEYINSQNSNVIADIIQQRLQQFGKQKKPKFKVQN